ncbi:MAG: OmpP1/FadL family transporter, partial [Gammaproteobacteria bacterium]
HDVWGEMIMIIKQSALWLAVAGVLAGTGAQASGFALQEQGVSGLGQAYAGSAAVAEDASTIWFNPAGMTRLEGRSAVAGGHGLLINAEFTNQGSSLSATGTAALSATLPAVAPTTISGANADGGVDAFVPNFYYAMPMGEKGWFGLGVNVPFGLSTEYPQGWVGRYHALESTMTTINASPSFAYKFNDKVSFGGGLNILYADATLTNAIDLAGVCRGLEFATTFAAGTCAATGQATTGSTASDGRVELSGDGMGYGFNLSTLIQATDRTRIGFSFKSQISMELEGRADFTNPTAGAAVWTAANLFQDTNAKAKVRLPASFSASIAHELDDKWTLLADVTRTNWSSFQELRFKFDNATQPDGVTTEDWDDSYRVSLGGQYQYSPAMLLRAGIAYDQTPVPNDERRTARIPDSDRTWLSFGVGYKPSDNLTIDAAFTHVMADSVNINNTLEGSVATANHTLTGRFEGEVNLFSVQARYEF